ncbi:MAG: MFS transporter [Proteobacteria bacterium]|nr:MAG: MFS transporter [Pseudomonadota bacterium]
MSVLRKFIDIRAGEGKALAWSWLYVFALFLSYYVLRPIREDLGVSGGVENLPWLFTGTLLCMIAVNPMFGFAVRKWSRSKFIAITYRFFMMNLLVFMIFMATASPNQLVWIGRAFFIWISVFNLFVVSVFWSFIVDVFDSEQGARLFGFLAAGATLGGIAGSALTSALVGRVGHNWLLFASLALIEVAVFASRRLAKVSERFRSRPAETEKGMGGGVFAGISHTFRSPYLLGISAFIILYTVTSTFLYFQQASIADQNFTDRATRTAFFANIDLWVNILTLGFQLLLTARLIGLVGLTAVLCALPFISTLGFLALAVYPTVAVLVAVQVTRRVSNFAFAKPAREVLFTSIPREDRYKAKNFIDTVIYRGGDQVASWSYVGLLAAGLTMSGISFVAIPLSLVWFGVSVWLGRKGVRDAKSY